MHEVRKVYQNIDIKFHHNDRNITVYNKNFFRDFSNYYLEWELLEKGKIVKNGRLNDIDISPRKQQKFNIEIENTSFKGSDLLMNVFIKLKNQEPLLEKDYVVACEQLEIKPYDHSLVTFLPSSKELSYFQDENKVYVKGENFNFEFNKQTARISSYSVNGIDIISKGGNVNFWRPPTDNDYGAKTPSIYFEWKDAFDKNITRLSSVIKDTETGILTINCISSILSNHAKLNQQYQINALGKIHLKNELIVLEGRSAENMIQAGWEAKIQEGTHSNIYRFGNQFELLSEFENINYYGRGPVENEVDRKQAAFVGNYKSRVIDFLNMYARPQYGGNRTDVRWFEITNEDGFGIKIEGDSLINFSASHYSQNDLDSGPIKKNSQKHGKLLNPRENIYLNVDGFTMGVGCVDSWKSLPRKEYLLPYQNYKFGYTISPINN
jgi:beta-galactosidase